MPNQNRSKCLPTTSAFHIISQTSNASLLVKHLNPGAQSRIEQNIHHLVRPNTSIRSSWTVASNKQPMPFSTTPRYQRCQPVSEEELLGYDGILYRRSNHFVANGGRPPQSIAHFSKTEKLFWYLPSISCWSSKCNCKLSRRVSASQDRVRTDGGSKSRDVTYELCNPEKKNKACTKSSR